MDMRSLNTSLPKSSPNRQTSGQSQQTQSPENLLSAFKAAALSVTNLYKTAATDQVQSRAAGYQDALDELLSFLDKENLGLGDGEGWRVRQWATERLNSSNFSRRDNDEDEDGAAEEEESNNTSPELSRKDLNAEDHNEELSLPQPETAPDAALEPVKQDNSRPHLQGQIPVLPTSNFEFRSSHPYPTNHDREVDMEKSTEDLASTNNNPTETSRTPLRVELHPRTQRSNRHARSTTNRQTSQSSGAKRKLPFGDFFDISGVSFDGKDASGRGGGKRGKHA